MKQLAFIILFLFISLKAMPQDDNAKVKEFITQGIKLHDEKKYPEAILSYKEALKIEPGNPNANYEIAFTLMSTGANKDAIPYLERVTKTKNGTTASAYDMLGSIYDDLDEKEKAIANFKMGIEANPGNQGIYYNIAITYGRMGKDKEALSYLIQSLKMKPLHAGSHRLYALLTMNNSLTKVDAVLAFCNFLILEPNSERSISAFKDLQVLLGSGVAKTEKGSNISIGSGGDSERNAANLAVSMSSLSAGLIPGLSEIERLQQQLKMIFSTIGELSAKTASKEFFWSFYGDYVDKIAKSEFMPVAAHIIGFTANQKENQQWINENQVQFVNFGKWQEANARKEL